jgi:hypothetical protein
VFENRVLRRIPGREEDEVTEEWRKLHNDELNDLYSSLNKIAKNEMGGACSAYGERRGIYRVLVGKPDGKRPLGRPRRRWEYHINMELHEVGCGLWTGSRWLKIGTGGGHL